MLPHAVHISLLLTATWRCALALPAAAETASDAEQTVEEAGANCLLQRSRQLALELLPADEANVQAPTTEESFLQSVGNASVSLGVPSHEEDVLSIDEDTSEGGTDLLGPKLLDASPNIDNIALSLEEFSGEAEASVKSQDASGDSSPASSSKDTDQHWCDCVPCGQTTPDSSLKGFCKTTEEQAGRCSASAGPEHGCYSSAHAACDCCTHGLYQDNGLVGTPPGWPAPEAAGPGERGKPSIWAAVCFLGFVFGGVLLVSQLQAARTPANLPAAGLDSFVPPPPHARHSHARPASSWPTAAAFPVLGSCRSATLLQEGPAGPPTATVAVPFRAPGLQAMAQAGRPASLERPLPPLPRRQALSSSMTHTSAPGSWETVPLPVSGYHRTSSPVAAPKPRPQPGGALLFPGARARDYQAFADQGQDGARRS